jgi:hypothetical protein
MRQEQLAELVDPTSPPELPSQLEALPIAYGYWFLFLAAAALFLWWSWHWMRQAQRDRKTQLQERKVVDAEASASSAHTALSMLHSFMSELSADQRREAECLSHLLREQVGRSLKRDCHSATDEELLSNADATEKDLALGILAPLLAFTSGVLFADQRPEVAIWKATLKDVEVWLETQGEQL